MAVEAGLADQELEAPSELARDAIDVGAQVVEPRAVVAHRLPDPGCCPIFAEGLAQSEGPFAGGDAGFCADDRGWHDVAAAPGAGAQLLEGGGHQSAVAHSPPGLELPDLVGFRLR